MILIVDNYDSFTYNLYQYVASIYPNVEVIRNDQFKVADLKSKNIKGIILSPGPGRPEDAGICIELIRSLDKTIPLLGVCLGHQAIAKAFGGEVIPAPQIMHGKHDSIKHHQKGIYESLPSPLKVARYHSLIAEKESLPDSLQIESENNEGIIMGVKHKSLPIYGVQFHPESILTPLGGKLIKNFLQKCYNIIKN